MTYFEQEFVMVDADEDKKEGKIYVTGRTIDYQKNFQDTQFVINYFDGDRKEDRQMKVLANAFLKKIKFGDVVKVFGDTLNKVVMDESAEDESDDGDDLLSLLGVKRKPNHAGGGVKTYINEMRINGVEAWDRGVYTEDDFVSDNLLEENDFESELGGKKKPSKNPFDFGDDDDLPF